MKRFVYRFQRLLEIKERVEEERRIAMGRAVAVWQTQNDRLKAIQQGRAEHGVWRQGQSGNIEAYRLGAHYDLRLLREIAQQTERVSQAQAVVEEKRRHLVEATRQRRTFEILRQRQAEEHRKKVLRREQIEMDEVGERQRRRLEREAAAVARQESERREQVFGLEAGLGGGAVGTGGGQS